MRLWALILSIALIFGATPASAATKSINVVSKSPRVGNLTLYQNSWAVLIGIIHRRQGRYAQAMEAYKKSLAIKKRLGNRSGIAITRLNMGVLASKQGNLGLAIRYTKEARDIFRSLGSPHVKVAEKALLIYRRKAGR